MTIKQIHYLFFIGQVLLALSLEADASWNVRGFLVSSGSYRPTNKSSSIHQRSDGKKAFADQTKSLSHETQKDPKKPKSPWKKRRCILHALNSGDIEAGPRKVHHFLYWITALDAVLALGVNDYGRFPIRNNAGLVPSVYKKLFYFARLRPRLLFSLGAYIRALQLCTPFQNIIDPSIGVGAGINLFAILCGSRWVKPIILGWTCTKCFWVWLGASTVRGAHVTVSLLQGDHVPISLYSNKQQQHQQQQQGTDNNTSEGKK